MKTPDPLSLAALLMTEIRPSKLEIARDRERERSKNSATKMNKKQREKRKQREPI
jgi:hypothetical protein